MKARLPQVRKWQEEQGALDGALDRLSRATGVARPMAGDCAVVSIADQGTE